MSDSPTPRAALGESDARLMTFRSYAIAHPLLTKTHEALIQAIREPAGASLIFVFGPTGVGKTTLKTRLVRALMQDALPALQEDRGRMPPVAVDAVAPDSGNFNWKDFYIRALDALREPLIRKKIYLGEADAAGSGAQIARANLVAPELRRALEQCLLHRRPAAFIIDEAQHLLKLAGGRRLADQLDTIKSLATLTGTVHILIGTYDLLAFRHLSAQLSRRALDIHFRRYCLDDKDDMHSFRSILWNFQRQMPFEKPPDLVQHWPYFYERSVGCIGILKDWLTKALAVALRDKCLTLSLGHLESTAFSTSQCETMAKDILRGEEAMIDTPSARRRLRIILSLDSDTRQSADAIDARPSVTPTKKPASFRRTPRPGQRAPVRDPVGIDKHAN